jgi:hypothetical protein
VLSIIRGDAMRTIITIVIIAVIIAGIVVIIKRRSGAKYQSKFSEEENERHYEIKQAALERILGPMHDLVGHALIPFQVGGAVDMYYFPNGIPGTGFATMELIEPDGSGPKPNRIGTYELVTFTREKIPPSDLKDDEDHPFNDIQGRMCAIMTSLGFYSYEAVLNPGETCEIPAGEEDEPNYCLIFDEYKQDGVDFEIDGKKHCLLLVIEVFKSEMEYAMENGSTAVINKLKEKGYYPYSDLEREPVY